MWYTTNVDKHWNMMFDTYRVKKSDYWQNGGSITHDAKYKKGIHFLDMGYWALQSHRSLPLLICMASSKWDSFIKSITGALDKNSGIHFMHKVCCHGSYLKCIKNFEHLKIRLRKEWKFIWEWNKPTFIFRFNSRKDTLYLYEGFKKVWRVH